MPTIKQSEIKCVGEMKMKDKPIKRRCLEYNGQSFFWTKGESEITEDLAGEIVIARIDGDDLDMRAAKRALIAVLQKWDV